MADSSTSSSQDDQHTSTQNDLEHSNVTSPSHELLAEDIKLPVSNVVTSENDSSNVIDTERVYAQPLEEDTIGSKTEGSPEQSLEGTAQIDSNAKFNQEPFTSQEVEEQINPETTITQFASLKEASPISVKMENEVENAEDIDEIIKGESADGENSQSHSSPTGVQQQSSTETGKLDRDFSSHASLEVEDNSTIERRDTDEKQRTGGEYF